MKKTNCKKGISTLMAAIMGMSTFAATASNISNASFRNFDNSINTQCQQRASQQSQLRQQRREEMMANRRAASNALNDALSYGNGTASLIGAGLSNLFGFMRTKPQNVQNIENIITRFATEKNCYMQFANAFIGTIANYLDGLGFSDLTITNILTKLDSALEQVGNNVELFFAFNADNYVVFTNNIFNGSANVNVLFDIENGRIYKDILINTFYKNVNGKYELRTPGEAAEMHNKTLQLLNFLQGLIFNN